MLQTAVLPLGVLPDDHDIYVLMTCLDSWERLAVHHVSKKVQAGAVNMQRDRGKKDPLRQFRYAEEKRINL